LGTCPRRGLVPKHVIPALTKEVNEGKNFAQLRQVFYSLILATWYKKKIKDSILNKVYSNQKKIQGLTPTRGHVPEGAVSPSPMPSDSAMNMKAPQGNTVNDVEVIYQRYLQAFKKGVYNYIKEGPDADGQMVPRKYFSGGVKARYQFGITLTTVDRSNANPAQMADLAQISLIDVTADASLKTAITNAAMNTSGPVIIEPYDQEKYGKIAGGAILGKREWLLGGTYGYQLILTGSATNNGLRRGNVFGFQWIGHHDLQPLVFVNEGLANGFDEHILWSHIFERLDKDRVFREILNKVLKSDFVTQDVVKALIAQINKRAALYTQESVQSSEDLPLMISTVLSQNRTKDFIVQGYGTKGETYFQNGLILSHTFPPAGAGKGSIYTLRKNDGEEVGRVFYRGTAFAKLETVLTDMKAVSQINVLTTEQEKKERLAVAIRSLRHGGVFFNHMTGKLYDSWITLGETVPETTPVLIILNSMRAEFSVIEKLGIFLADGSRGITKSEYPATLAKLQEILSNVDMAKQAQHKHIDELRNAMGEDFNKPKFQAALAGYLASFELLKLKLESRINLVEGKAGSDKITVEDLVKLLQSSVSSASEGTSSKVISFDSEGTDDIVLGYNRFLLASALFNITYNAFEKVRDSADGRVLVKFERKDQKLLITVSDNGPGITKSFDEMAVLNHSTKTEDGGLGLTEVKYAIRDIGGTVAASNRPEGGAVFTTEVPINEAMITSTNIIPGNNTGGIDLNPAQMSMQIKKQGEDFKFDFNGTQIDAAQVTGAAFTIRQMIPVTNLPQILGFNQK
jgi:signal transduction histidine kinase